METSCGRAAVRVGQALVLSAALSLVLAAHLGAQGQNDAPAPAAPRAAAPKDLTGYWVSVVSEDWRWRMVIPDKSDYVNVPLSAEGRRVADAWDPAKDQAAGEQCRGWGAAAIMEVPGRLHITWQDDNTLKMDIDSGTQTRILHFGASNAPAGAATWQGYSVAHWGDPSEPIDQRIGGGGPAGQGGPEYDDQVPIGSGGPGVAGTNTKAQKEEEAAAPTTRGPRKTYLYVITTHMRPGYLRKNGVPYGANATLQEYITRFTDPYQHSDWLMVTTVVSDPQYLIEPYITHAHFKKIADNSGWDPTQCKVDEAR